MILNKNNDVVSSKYGNIIYVSLNSCAGAMRQCNKYKNFLIFTALAHRSEMDRWN